MSAQEELDWLDEQQAAEGYNSSRFLDVFDVEKEAAEAWQRFRRAMTSTQRRELRRLVRKVFKFKGDFDEGAVRGILRKSEREEESSSRGYLRGYIGVVSRMFRKRSANLAEYKQRYSTVKSEYVSHTADVLVDFDYWLGGKESCSSMQEQVQLHEKIHQMTDGFNLPILGVNPIKVILDEDEYLRFIDSTLKRGIFRGVKLYPTLGYSPDGELIKDFAKHLKEFPDDVDLPTKESMRSALDKIYNLCKKYDAFVMAHTDRSKGVTPTSPKLTSPEQWENVLKRHPSLKVNFGHMGELVDIECARFSWTHRFLRLMNTYDNVYGDLGYWFELTKVDGVQLLDGIIRSLDADPEKLYRRVMFGTDWYMIGTERRWQKYMTNSVNSFRSKVEQGQISQQNMDNLFRHNAARLFNISP
jgi:predicted TIM-barrel fold metal-dependent hydrolase